MPLSIITSLDAQGIILGSLILDIVTFAIFLAFVLFTESLILWGVDWGKYPLSLLHAVLMNLVSFGVVYLVINLIPDVGIFYVIIAIGLSILLEGLILMALRRRHTIRKAWVSALLANLISAGVAILVVFLKGFFT